jgi:hypothetical protein
MASGRQYAQLRTAIWRDEDWCRLPTDAQWLYEVLISQPSISTAGVIALQITKWANYSSDMTVKRVKAALKVLRERNYILVDEQTEEVLVRTFIRHDLGGGAVSPKVMVAALRCAIGTQSDDLRAVLLAEVQRLERAWPEYVLVLVDDLEKTLVNRVSDTLSDTVSDTLPDTPCLGLRFYETQTDRPEVTSMVTCSTQEQVPKSGTSPARARGMRLPDDWQPPDEVIRAMHTELPHLDLRAQHRRFTDYWRAASGQKGVKLDWAATWRNWMRTANERGETQVTTNGHPIGRATEKAMAFQAMKDPVPDNVLALPTRRELTSDHAE